MDVGFVFPHYDVRMAVDFTLVDTVDGENMLIDN